MDRDELLKLKKFTDGWDYEITKERKDRLLKYVGKRILCKEYGLCSVASIQYEEKRRNIGGNRWNRKWESVRCLTSITYKTTDDLLEIQTLKMEANYGVQTLYEMKHHLDAYKRFMKQQEVFDKAKL